MVSPINGWSEEDLTPVAESIINLDKENALVTDKDFNNFLGKQKDINAWISTNNINNIRNLEGLDEGLGLFGGIKNNYGHIFLDFQKGYLTLNTNLRFNKF